MRQNVLAHLQVGGVLVRLVGGNLELLRDPRLQLLGIALELLQVLRFLL